jgi:ATP-dependent helicase HrpA
MVLEAEQRGCLREVTVIAAALSIQDPRERPADQAQAAGEMHRRFVVPDSDFMGFLRLWDYLAELQAGLSGNQFRKRCRAEFLNVLRIREWQDVAGQIRQVYRAQGIHANRDPADPDQIHQALLAGLLSHLGRRDRVRGDYQGARNSRWQIGRASALARRQPTWAMAGELVETERTWARTVSTIEPAWAERAGAHLVRRSFSEPWWDAGRGEAMTDERVTLYGLPVVEARRLSLARTDPAEARRMFVERALVQRDWPVTVDVLERNADRIAQVRALEDRVRRRDLLAGEEPLLAFYDTRIPAEVTNGRRFERWWRRVRDRDPDSDLLDVPFTVLVNPAAGPVDVTAYPDRWVQGELELTLRYRYEPGAVDDGVTAVVPLAVVNRLRPEGFDWSVRGLRPDLIVALVRSVPKPVRRALGPAAEVAHEVLATTGPADGPLLDAVARTLARLSGEPVTPDVWDLDVLPAYLRLGFEVVDEDGRVVARGRDLDRLRRDLAGEIRAALARVAPGLERHGATTWEFGDLPRIVERGLVRAYPALVDERDAVGVALVDTAAAQADHMWRGTRRLLLLAAPLPAAHVQRRLSSETKLAVAGSRVALADLVADCAAAVADQIIVTHGGPAFDASGFAAMAAVARGTLVDQVVRVATIAGGALAAAEGVDRRVDRLERGGRSATGPLADALADVRHQVDNLVPPGFVSATGTARLANLLRYLDAASRRLDRLPTDIRRDAQRQAAVERVQSRYETLVDQVVAGTARPGVTAGLSDIRWMVEELRVSLWAQVLGTPAPVSEERIMRTMGRMIAT